MDSITFEGKKYRVQGVHHISCLNILLGHGNITDQETETTAESVTTEAMTCPAGTTEDDPVLGPGCYVSVEILPWATIRGFCPDPEMIKLTDKTVSATQMRKKKLEKKRKENLPPQSLQWISTT